MIYLVFSYSSSSSQISGYCVQHVRYTARCHYEGRQDYIGRFVQQSHSQYNSLMNKPAPKIFRTTNWSTYKRALINRGNISIWFDPLTQWYAHP